MGWFGQSKQEHEDEKRKEFTQKYQAATTADLKQAEAKLEQPPEALSFGKKAMNYMWALGLSPEGMIAQVAGFMFHDKLATRFKMSHNAALVVGSVVVPAAVSVIPAMRYNNAEYQEQVEDQNLEKSFVKKLLQERESAAQQQSVHNHGR